MIVVLDHNVNQDNTRIQQPQYRDPLAQIPVSVLLYLSDQIRISCLPRVSFI